MARIDDDTVIELQVVISKRVEQVLGEFFGLPLSQQIGPAGRTDKQRVAGQYAPRIFGTVPLREFVGEMFRCVTGRVACREDDRAERKAIPIVRRIESRYSSK